MYVMEQLQVWAAVRVAGKELMLVRGWLIIRTTKQHIFFQWVDPLLAQSLYSAMHQFALPPPVFAYCVDYPACYSCGEHSLVLGLSHH
jgi:hypothetical protein